MIMLPLPTLVPPCSNVLFLLFLFVLLPYSLYPLGNVCSHVLQELVFYFDLTVVYSMPTLSSSCSHVLCLFPFFFFVFLFFFFLFLFLFLRKRDLHRDLMYKQCKKRALQLFLKRLNRIKLFKLLHKQTKGHQWMKNLSTRSGNNFS